ncbi:hypothetical protein Droror1_Dr00008892 [Drosera rotundifolia]
MDLFVFGNVLCRALEETSPDEAIQLYTDGCTILEENGKEQMAFDLYCVITSINIKVQKCHDKIKFRVFRRRALGHLESPAPNQLPKPPTLSLPARTGNGVDNQLPSTPHSSNEVSDHKR